MATQVDECIPTRQSLLGRLRDWGDEQGWQRFFNTYWRLIYGVALKSGLTEAEAQDVVQETVLSVARTMPKFQYDPAVCSFKTWLHHLTRKRIADQFRKRPPASIVTRSRRKEEDRTDTVERIPDPAGFNLDAAWDEEWRKTLLNGAMERVKEKVNPRQYQMFYLYAIKRQPIQEVARSLRVNVGQVYLAKHRVSALIKREVRLLEAEPI
jgi:RNA polymerase sigma-70 factor (ECF subfamily)